MSDKPQATDFRQFKNAPGVLLRVRPGKSTYAFQCRQGDWVLIDESEVKRATVLVTPEEYDRLSQRAEIQHIAQQAKPGTLKAIVEAGLARIAAQAGQ